MSRQPAGPNDAAVRAWRELRNLVQSNDRRRRVADALGMSFIRSKALRRLAQEPMSMRRLAEELATDRPYTTVFVDDLEQRGLVVRRPDPSDRRGKIVHLTPAGRKVAEQAELILDTPPDAFTRLSAAELRRLEEILQKLD
ncbi:MarR family winged helix-turn-helix transcriptional regulator [Microlunatus elymi]|nr:MarR family transcriptional regulator [Microlunatus elymi]